jgi:hypothetical protein
VGYHRGYAPALERLVREPILIGHDDSPDAVRAIEAAAALLGRRRAVVVDVLPWMTPAESLAATSSLVRGNDFETLNRAEARRIASRRAEICARPASTPSRAASSRVAPGKESSTPPTSSTPP